MASRIIRVLREPSRPVAVMGREGIIEKTRFWPGRGGAGRDVKLLLVTNRDWFASALEGVLEAESYTVHRKETVEGLLEAIRRGGAGAVIVDAHLEDVGSPEAIRRLRGDFLGRDVPILVYASGLQSDDLYAEYLDAGAWNVIEGPVRSRRLLAVMRRFLAISGRHSRESEEATREEETGLPNLEGLLERLPVVEALARREKASIAVMAVGPTGSGDRSGEPSRRQRVADVCLEGLRKSDLCGWLDAGEEVAVVAYSASREGARVLVERLARMAAEQLELERPQQALSAGIVELSPDDLSDEVRAEDRADAQVELLSRARKALEEARREGGGVRFAS